MQPRCASLALALLLGLAHTAVAEPPHNPTIHIDGCDAGGGSADISALAAAFDPNSEEIRIDLDLCAPPDDHTKYRLRIDHATPLHSDDDRNGDGLVDELDSCADTADSGMMLHCGNRATGPGSVGIDDQTLRYRIAIADLEPARSPATASICGPTLSTAGSATAHPRPSRPTVARSRSSRPRWWRSIWFRLSR